MTRWAESPEHRDQMVLFTCRLDDALPQNHVVRLLDEILARMKWSQWEELYHDRLGRPAIHPQVLASVLIYGFLNRIRSSRGLEEALQVRMDFRWLVEGRLIDHSTISEFRRQHKKELKELFIQVCQLAQELGILTLQRLGFDATRSRANNRRTGTRTIEDLRQERDELAAKFDELHQQADAEDSHDEELFQAQSPQELPSELRDPTDRLAKLNAVLDEFERAKEEGRSVPNRVPITDLDSRVMPNKDGGHAPNYTPTATVDIASGLIVGAEVLAVINEDAYLIPALEEVQKDFGLTSPLEVLTDGLNGTGANLAECHERGITIYSPCEIPDPSVNPALRDDPTQPVAEADWDRLPTYKVNIKGEKKLQLDKSAFVYDREKNCYWCPMGKALPYANTTSEASRSGRRVRARYKADKSDCGTCPLRSRCLQRENQSRQINREQYEDHRERHAQHMAKPESQTIYGLRSHAGERPFAMIKHHFGLRRFLLRGLERVQNEWRWATIAFNLHRLMSLLRSRDGPRESLLPSTPIPLPAPI